MGIFIGVTTRFLDTKFSSSFVLIFGEYSQFFSTQDRENCRNYVMICTSRFKRGIWMSDLIAVVLLIEDEKIEAYYYYVFK